MVYIFMTLYGLQTINEKNLLSEINRLFNNNAIT
jgi:hypothetical protein